MCRKIEQNREETEKMRQEEQPFTIFINYVESAKMVMQLMVRISNLVCFHPFLELLKDHDDEDIELQTKALNQF